VDVGDRHEQDEPEEEEEEEEKLAGDDEDDQGEMITPLITLMINLINKS